MNRYFFIFLLLFSKYSFGLDIENAIKNTVQNNFKVKIGIEKIIESKELIENATGKKLPTITGTVTGTYSNSEIETATTETTPETFTDNYKINITQNLYDAGFNNLEIERSKILFDNEMINFQITIQELILEAIRGYLTVINYKNSHEANKKNYEFVNKALSETKTKFDLGSSTLYELQNSESSFAVASANLFAAEQNYEVSKKAFKRIVGLEAINLEDVIDINYNLDPKMIYNNAIKKNLNLKLLSNNIENNKILLLKEKKSKLPNLDLTGSGEYSDSSHIDAGSETTKGTLKLSLTIPIFQQNIDNSNIRKYYSLISQSELDYQDYVDELNIQISNTYKDLLISKANMESNLSLIKATKTSLSSLEQEYDLGTKTIMDLVEEEGKLLSANVNYLNSKKDYLVNYFVLKSLEGELIEQFNKYIPEIN